jgi:hypothetical protein
MWGGHQEHGNHGHGHHGHHNNHHGHSHSHSNEHQTQQWSPSKGQYYRIISGLSSHMVLDVSQSKQDFNHLIIYEWNGGNNQKFYF